MVGLVPTTHDLKGGRTKRGSAARADWIDDQMLMMAEAATPETLRAARSTIAALKKRGWYLRRKAERDAERDPEPDGEPWLD